MAYNCAADSFHKKKLCSRLSSSEVHIGLSYSIKIWTDLSSVTRVTDRQTDKILITIPFKKVHFQPVLPNKT